MWRNTDIGQGGKLKMQARFCLCFSLCHSRRKSAAVFAVALAFALAFLSVIPEGNLLLPLQPDAAPISPDKDPPRSDSLVQSAPSSARASNASIPSPELWHSAHTESTRNRPAGGSCIAPYASHAHPLDASPSGEQGCLSSRHTNSANGVQEYRPRSDTHAAPWRNLTSPADRAEQQDLAHAPFGLASAVALVFAFALAFAAVLVFLSVIPEGNLLLHLPLPLLLLLPLPLPFFLSFPKGICCCRVPPISILRWGKPQPPALSLPLPLPSLKAVLNPSYQINNPPKAHTEEVTSQAQSAPRRSRHRHLPAVPKRRGNSHAKRVQKAHKYAVKAPLSHPKIPSNHNKLLYLEAEIQHPPPVLPRIH